jgi:hypothetical protein
MTLRSRATDAAPTGAAVGVTAFLLTYLVAYAVKSGEIASRLELFSVLTDPPALWQGVAWVVYAIHLVPVTTTGSVAGQSLSATLSGGEVRDAWLLLVPVAVLLAAGYLLARRFDAASPAAGAAVGATAVSGYLALGALGLSVVGWSRSGSVLGGSVTVAVGPDPVLGVVAALAYPLVFGALGGAVAGFAAGETSNV